MLIQRSQIQRSFQIVPTHRHRASQGSYKIDVTRA